MGLISIDPGEIEELSGNEGDVFRVEPQNGRIKVSDRKRTADTGDTIVQNEQARIILEDGDGLFIFNPTDGTVKVNINPQGLIIANRSQIIQQVENRSHDGVATQSYTASEDNDVFSFDSQAIPNGTAQLTVFPDSNNDGNVLVEGDTPLRPDDSASFSVNNFDAVSFTVENSGDSVYAIAEVDN